MTCWRRLRDWQAAGVWQTLHEVLLAHFGVSEGATLDDGDLDADGDVDLADLAALLASFGQVCA